MNLVNALGFQQNGQIYNSSLLPSSQDSYPSFYNTLLFVGIGIGTFGIVYAWNKLKERKINQVSPTNTDLRSAVRASWISRQNSTFSKKEEQASSFPTNRTEMHSRIERSSLTSLTLTKSSMNTFERFEKFYQNQETDVIGRVLSDLQNMSFDKKEYTHDYIQWLFPTDQKSAFNFDAPVFNLQQFTILNQNPVIKENVKLSFIKMLEFYGLRYDDSTWTVYKDDHFEKRARNWLTLGNHNFLRISRILRCLVLFECNQEAQAFYSFLKTLDSHPALKIENFVYWEEASQPVVSTASLNH